MRPEVHGVGGHALDLCPHKWGSREFLAEKPAQAKARARGLKQHRTTEEVCEVRGPREAACCPALGRCPLS